MEGVTEYDDLMKIAGLLHEESWGSSEKVNRSQFGTRIIRNDVHQAQKVCESAVLN